MAWPTARFTQSPTLVGSLAIGLWSTLATMTTRTTQIPAFQLTAIGLGVATLAFVVRRLATPACERPSLRQPPGALVLGVYGIFGFHFFYFMALRTAPALESNLVIYLWPLLIVLFSAMLPGERLRWWHVAGAMLGLSGTVLLVLGNGSSGGFDPAHLHGFAYGAISALIWSSYSVLMRRHRELPTETVAVHCAISAVLSLVCHLAFETTGVPEGAQWAILLAMGLGPLGAAFFLWDYGVKRGNVRLLGILSYSTPLMSTGWLLAFGAGELTVGVAVAGALVVAGALTGSLDALWPQRFGGGAKLPRQGADAASPSPAD